MKWVSLLYVIVTIILVVYEFNFSNSQYKNLVQYLKENLFFIHSKIISACVYINSVNLKWLKYGYIEEVSCPGRCSDFYINLLEDNIFNLNEGKESLSTFDKDFQEIILKRRNITVSIFNTNITDILRLDVNDNLNFIVTKGIRLCGNFKNYMNYFGNEQINMVNLIRQTLEYFEWGVGGCGGDEKIKKVNSKFGGNYLSIIFGIILCVILLTVFTYFIFKFNKLEIFFLDKLINFNSPNFEVYLKNLEDLKKKLKNYKNDEDENNLDELELEMEAKSNEDSKKKNSKNKEEKNKKLKKTKEGTDNKSKYNQKKGSKQNKLQLQRLRKKKVMSFYFYKENILFAVKISLILICFVSYFVVSFLVFKAYYNNFLEFDEITNNMEELYYQSFKTFLEFKSQLASFETNTSYFMELPDGKDIQIPNFGNILNELTQNRMYSEKNKNTLNQLYNGDMCKLLFNRTDSEEYTICKEFLSSILLKGMEQAIIQMGVLINSVIDEISLVYDSNSFKELVWGNITNFKKYELFVEYFLYYAYLENEEIFNGLRNDQTHYYSNLTMEILIIYFIGYLFLFILLCYFIFQYKYIYVSLFNFCAILSLKSILDDEYLYQKILELEKELYN